MAIIAGEERCALGGPWVPGGGIELPYLYNIYAAKTRNRYTREKLENGEKRIILSETQNLLLSYFFTQGKGLFEGQAYARVSLMSLSVGGLTQEYAI